MAEPQALPGLELGHPHKREAALWLLNAFGEDIFRIVESYRAVLHLHRPMMESLEALCYGHESCLAKDGNPQITAFREGQRAVWLHIEAVASLTGGELETLIKEVNDHVRRQQPGHTGRDGGNAV